MKADEYIKKALRTEPKEYRFEGLNGVSARLEHGVMGVVTEAGELMDAVKKSKIYGREFDTVNVVEEVGDVMWYLAIMCDELGVSFEEVWDKNVRKLEKRFPEKYTEELVMNRDLKAERDELEK